VMTYNNIPISFKNLLDEASRILGMQLPLYGSNFVNRRICLTQGFRGPNVPTCNSLLSAFLRTHRFPTLYEVLPSIFGFRNCNLLYRLTSCSSAASQTSEFMVISCFVVSS
ncbi:hypothetical protein IFM89_015408, partial [Coptis chinensis]